MHPLTLTSNYNSGYYASSNMISKLNSTTDRDTDSPGNKKVNSSLSPKLNHNLNSSQNSKHRECSSPGESSTQQTSSGLSALISNYMSSSNMQIISSKSSKNFTKNCSNNENNINKHNINNNLSSRNHNPPSDLILDSITNIDYSLKPLTKLRKFMSTLLQFANNISSECADQVHTLILGLISSSYTIEEFQLKVQEITNYPLKPFVVSFLSSFLPILQNEINHLARSSKLTLNQFVKQNETIFLEKLTTSNFNSLPVNQTNSNELDDLLFSTTNTLKRRYSPDILLNSNLNQQPAKRFQTLNHVQRTESPKLNQKSSNPNANILHNHLTQARTAMLEELMSNRLYSTPIQQQLNLINQNLNQQINQAQKLKQQQSLTSHLSSSTHSANNLNDLPSVTLTSNHHQLASSISYNNGNNKSNMLTSTLSTNKSQLTTSLDRLALIERYEKELFLQSKQTNLNTLQRASNFLDTTYNQTNSHQAHLPQQQQQQQQQMQQIQQQQQMQQSVPAGSTSAHHLLTYSALSQQNYHLPPSSNDMSNIITMLNCIIGMVEKTKSALNILQQKNKDQQQQYAKSISPCEWNTTRNLKQDSYNKNRNQNSSKAPLSPLVDNNSNDYLDLRKTKEILNFSPLTLNTPKLPFARIPEQTNLMSFEKSKIERIFNDIRKQATEDVLASVNVQENSVENCWNCGRKANETCSGCNEARYCGSFCQHKDWETHQIICGKNNNKILNLDEKDEPKFSNKLDYKSDSPSPNLVKENEQLDTDCDSNKTVKPNEEDCESDSNQDSKIIENGISSTSNSSKIAHENHSKEE